MWTSTLCAGSQINVGQNRKHCLMLGHTVTFHAILLNQHQLQLKDMRLSINKLHYFLSFWLGLFSHAHMHAVTTSSLFIMPATVSTFWERETKHILRCNIFTPLLLYIHIHALAIRKQLWLMQSKSGKINILLTLKTYRSISPNCIIYQ